MTCDIFIRTHSGDAEYHRHCLRSIEKFCSGFRNVVVVNKDEPRGYLGQQVDKMEADLHTDADFVLITDSDTLFTTPVTPETYLRDGKSVWLHTPWTPEMLAHAGTHSWFRCMEVFFGVEPPSEFMRRQPFMVPRWLTISLREFCKARHGMSIRDFVMMGKSFSEFNVLGFHAWLHHRDRIAWIDTSKEPLPELTVRQFWSHDPIGKNIDEIESILA